MEKSGGLRLKQRLARMFRASFCNTSTTASIPASSATAASSRPLYLDVAGEPVSAPFHGLDRSLSLPSTPDVRLGRESSGLSLGCAGSRASRLSEPGPHHPPPKEKKESRAREMTESLLFSKTEEKKSKMGKKLLSNGYGFTSSSDNSDGEVGFFSSEGDAEKEMERFFSSRSFSSDSSDFYRHPSRKTKNKDKKKKKKKRQRRPPPRRGRSKSSSGGYNYKPPVVEESAPDDGGGFAMAKRSTDPYVDFQASMLEMIVERQVFGAEGLERLLQSYLSLNSPRHHPVILGAFTDICRVLDSF